MKTCIKVTVPGQCSVTLQQYGGKKFRVLYGSSVQLGLGYNAAAKAVGQCLMHALACDGKLDNTGPA